MIESADGRLLVKSAMTLESARALQEAGRALLATGAVVFDFSEVVEADSSAIAIMLDWLRQGKALGVAVSFAGIPPTVHSLADLYGVAELLPQI